MITRLCRWLNGMLSMLVVEDEKDLFQQLMKEGSMPTIERFYPHLAHPSGCPST